MYSCDFVSSCLYLGCLCFGFVFAADQLALAQSSRFGELPRGLGPLCHGICSPVHRRFAFLALRLRRTRAFVHAKTDNLRLSCDVGCVSLVCGGIFETDSMEFYERYSNYFLSTEL